MIPKFDSNDDDKDAMIASMMADINLYLTTISNLNHLISGLNTSTLYHQDEVHRLREKIDKKMDLVSKFLESKGFSVEDLYEFENELKLQDDE